MENKALVQQHPGFPVELVLDEFEGHRWFAQLNYEQALEHAQGTFYAHELGLQRQAALHMERLGNILTYDKSLKVVEIGKNMNFDCKLFGVIEAVNANMVRVESEHFSWCVFPLHQAEVAVPAEHLKRIMEFERNGIRFNGYGIAVPETIEHEPFIQALKRAAKDTWELFIQEVGVVVCLSVVGGAAAGIAAIAAVGTPVMATAALAAAAAHDPVLLGLFWSRMPGTKIFMVEIGRWL